MENIYNSILQLRTSESPPPCEIENIHDDIIRAASELNELPPDTERIEIIGHDFGPFSDGSLCFTVEKNAFDDIISGRIDFTTKGRTDIDFHVKPTNNGRNLSSILRYLDHNQPINNISSEIRELATIEQPNGADLWKALGEISLNGDIRTTKTYSYQDLRMSPAGKPECGAKLNMTLDYINELLNKTTVDVFIPHIEDAIPTEIQCRIIVDPTSTRLFRISYLDSQGRDKLLSVQEPDKLADLILQLISTTIQEHRTLATTSEQP